MNAITDHTGKTSQGRITALLGTGTACTLALAPLWGGPPPDLQLVLTLLGVPGGFALWQKMGAPKERE